MTTDANTPLALLHADGGAIPNLFLTQFIADILGTPLVIPSNTDLSPMGAAYAGLLGIGQFSSFDQLNEAALATKTISPQMLRSVAMTLHQGWKVALHQVLDAVR